MQSRERRAASQARLDRALQISLATPVGSDLARQHFGSAVVALSELFSEHLDSWFEPMWSVEICAEGEDRVPSCSNDVAKFQAQALEMCSLFTGAHGFLGSFSSELCCAFFDLQSGQTRDTLKPRSRKGGKPDLADLLLKAPVVRIVQLMLNVTQPSGVRIKVESIRSELEQVNLSWSTYKKMERQVREVPLLTKIMPIGLSTDSTIDELKRALERDVANLRLHSPFSRKTAKWAMSES